MTGAHPTSNNDGKNPHDTSELSASGKLYLKGTELRENLTEKRDELHGKYEKFGEKLDVPVSDKPRWARLTKADIFKLVGLIAFFALLVIVCILIWPLISELTEEGGLQNVVAQVQSAGPLGVFILLGFQFLQVVVAFIPGEVVQIAAGMMYGPWIGAGIIILGCVLSSIFIYFVVSKLGAPFVQAMIPEKWMNKLHALDESEKLDIIVFVLYLIPGLPKDVFTYLIPLTGMRMRDFVVISNIARIPGILMSTMAADRLIEGRFVQAAVLLVICAVIAVVAILFHEKIFAFFKRKKH